MSKVCSINGSNEKYVENFSQKMLMQRKNHVGDLGVDGWTMLSRFMGMTNKWGLDWMIGLIDPVEPLFLDCSGLTPFSFLFCSVLLM